MTSVLLTHGSMTLNRSHTAWLEIFAFERFVKTSSTSTKLLSHDLIDVEVLSNYDKIVVFNSTTVDARLMSALNESSIEVYLVYQDPNWGINFSLNREYVLITPFRRLKRLTSYKSVMSELKEVVGDVTLSKFSRHEYLPLGTMSLADSYYASIQTQIDVEPSHDVMYVGSYKKDRSESFKKMTELGVDIYGNIDEERFRRDLSLHAYSDLSLKGRVPATSVGSLASHYRGVVYAPDDKMLDLDVCHLRQCETFDSDIYVVDSESKKLVKHLNRVAIRFNSVKDIEGRTFVVYRFDQRRLENHYGLITKPIVQKVLNLEDLMTVDQFLKLSKASFTIDRSTKSVIKVQPTSVYYDADSNSISCEYQLEFVSDVENSIVDVVTRCQFNLSIRNEDLVKAIPFSIVSVKYQHDDNGMLTASQAMKLESIVKRAISQVISEQVENLQHV